MKLTFAFATLATISIGVLPLALSTSAHAHGYDKSVYVTEFWPGEYPNGFSVVATGVKLPARAAMDVLLPKKISCEVPYLANFHPWNSKRHATYWSASKIVPMIALKDLQLANDDSSPAADVKKGDLIEYLVYGAEGYFTVRYQGKEYGASQDLLENVSFDEKLMNAPVDQWVHIPCINGPKAWVLLADLSSKDKNGDDQLKKGLASWYLGFREYGQVTDLKKSDLKKQ